MLAYSVAIRMVGFGAFLAVAAGCATPDTSASRHAQAEPEAIPVQAPLTPAEEKDRADARQAYVACLRQATGYMTSNGTAGDAASLAAPLCYGQFSRFEDASTVAMSTRDKRAFDRAGDKRQLDYATDAVRQQSGLASLTPAKQ